MSEITCRGSFLFGNACGTCSKCKQELKDLFTRFEEDKNKPEITQTGLTGWTCPRCGRGNAPFTRTCPCIPFEVTC